MAARQGLDVTLGSSYGLSARVRELAGPGLERVQKRAMATLKRRAKPEIARLLSERVIALPPRAISPFISASVRESTLSVYGSRKRIPLSAFSPTPGARGVTATIWRDQGPRVFDHTFMQRGSKNVWQRVPYSGQKGQRVAPSGLVQRLPIVVRKGPSPARAVLDGKHGDIRTPFTSFARTTVSAEIERLLKVENGR